MVPGPPELVLASASPQRKAILEQLGVAFTVQPADVEELTEGDPAEVVVENALRKARAVDGRPASWAPTPRSTWTARSTARQATRPTPSATCASSSGRTHQVHSGIALRDRHGERTAVAVTHVTFRALSDAELAWYLGTGEWRDRAGAYAIQGRGSALVERIEGDFWNVVGLPVPKLLELAPDLVTGVR